MAALVGDLVPDLSRFHDTIVSPSSSRQNQRQQQQQQQQHHKYSPQRQGSHSHSHSHTQQPRDSPHRRSSSRPRASAAALTSRRGDINGSRVNRRNSSGEAPREAPRFPSDKTRTVETAADTTPTGGVPPKFPSPPPSSSPQATGSVSPADDAKGASMASQTGEVAPAPYQTLRNDSTSMNADASLQQPSPPSSQSQSFHLPGSSLASSSSFDRVESPPTQQTSQELQQTVVHVRDLAHMQTLADAKMLGGNNSTSLYSGNQIKYEISGMPIADVIEMVAALLTKITTTNDLQHDAMQRNVAHQQQANQSSDSGSHMSPLNHSVLAFHGKNVPAITILSYLSRIHKYCPTTYEVFLSLLVYFDRMTERVNEMVMRAHSQPIPPSASQRDTTMRNNAHESDESDSDLADDDEDDDGDDDDDDDDDDEMVDSPKAAAGRDDNSGVVATTDEQAAVIVNPATYFVVDSFNIHRLIISGVTCASKFFSDVFYTNSRYAKVGGLPLAELNHLEIQFLVLNDFRLAVPVEDLEAYATMLVEFYAREVMSQKSAKAGA